MANSSECDKNGALADLTLPGFMGRIAGPDATPGGGSVSALAGALAAALVAMVSGLTIAKKGADGVADEMHTIADQAAAIGSRLTQAIDADARAYGAVMCAFSLPKANPAEKSERSSAIQAAMQQAADVPLAVATDCLAAGDLAAVAMQKGNPNAASDAAVALLLALAGLEGAALNVATNLDSIKDQEYVAVTKGVLARLLAQSGRLRTELWNTARTRIHSLPLQAEVR